MARPAGTTDTRDRILAVAVRLFSERGYNGVSVRDIARGVGIKESSLYNHFESKDALIGAVYGSFAERMLSREVTAETVDSALDTMPAAEFFRNAFRVYAEIMTDPQSVMAWRILVTEQFRDPRANRLINEDIGAKLSSSTRLALERMRSRGLVRDVDPDVISVALNEAIKGMLFRFIGLGPEVRDEFLAAANRHIDFIWECIRA